MSHAIRRLSRSSAVAAIYRAQLDALKAERHALAQALATARAEADVWRRRAEQDRRRATERLGMTIRDYFAAASLRGYRASSAHSGTPARKLAVLAVDDADALIDELARPR